MTSGEGPCQHHLQSPAHLACRCSGSSGARTARVPLAGASGCFSWDLEASGTCLSAREGSIGCFPASVQESQASVLHMSGCHPYLCIQPLGAQPAREVFTLQHTCPAQGPRGAGGGRVPGTVSTRQLVRFPAAAGSRWEQRLNASELRLARGSLC